MNDGGVPAAQPVEQSEIEQVKNGRDALRTLDGAVFKMNEVSVISE